jgi:hypothetical protein
VASHLGPHLAAERSLVLAALRTALTGAASHELAAMSSGSVDWERILKQAEDECLAPLLYSMARALPVPGPVLERLRVAWVSGRRQFLLGSQQLTRVLSAFEHEGVPVIPLRGPALAELLYRDPGLRPFTDLDLLIHADHLPRALSLLSGLGYRHMEAGLPLTHELTWRHAASFTAEAPGEIPIDLHWGIVDYPGVGWAAGIAHQVLWDRAARVEKADGVRWELCPEDLLITLALHFAVHHALSGLLWQLDLALVVHRYAGTLEWDAVIERTRRWRIRGSVFFALREIRDRLEAPVPAWVLDRLRPWGLRPALYDWLRQRGMGYRERLDYLVPFLLMDGGSDTLRALASAVVPPASWLRCRYGKASVLGAYLAHCARIGRVCARTARASFPWVKPRGHPAEGTGHTRRIPLGTRLRS